MILLFYEAADPFRLCQPMSGSSRCVVLIYIFLFFHFCATVEPSAEVSADERGQRDQAEEQTSMSHSSCGLHHRGAERRPDAATQFVPFEKMGSRVKHCASRPQQTESN